MFSQSILTQRPVARQPQNRLTRQFSTAALAVGFSAFTSPVYCGNVAQIVPFYSLSSGSTYAEMTVRFYDTQAHAAANSWADANSTGSYKQCLGGQAIIMQAMPVLGQWFTCELRNFAGVAVTWSVIVNAAPAGVSSVQLLGPNSMYNAGLSPVIAPGVAHFFAPIPTIIAPGRWRIRWGGFANGVRFTLQQMVANGLWTSLDDGHAMTAPADAKYINLLAAQTRIAVVNAGAGATQIEAAITPAPA